MGLGSGIGSWGGFFEEDFLEDVIFELGVKVNSIRIGGNGGTVS